MRCPTTDGLLRPRVRVGSAPLHAHLKGSHPRRQLSGLGIRSRRRCCQMLVVSSRYQQESDRQRVAPQRRPSGQESEPTPPPPPPPPPRKKNSQGLPLWGVVAALLVGAGLWWFYIDSQMPQIYRDEGGLQYLLTNGGNKVIIGEDPEGRVYFVDQNGNFYYDSGDPNLGFYVVTTDNKVFNIFTDASDEQQRVFVGTFQDLKSQKITSLGGIPIEVLQRAYGKSFDGTVTGFTAPASKDKAPKAKDFGKFPVPKAIVEYEPDIVQESKVKDK